MVCNLRLRFFDTRAFSLSLAYCCANGPLRRRFAAWRFWDLLRARRVPWLCRRRLLAQSAIQMLPIHGCMILQSSVFVIRGASSCLCTPSAESLTPCLGFLLMRPERKNRLHANGQCIFNAEAEATQVAPSIFSRLLEISCSVLA